MINKHQQITPFIIDQIFSLARVGLNKSRDRIFPIFLVAHSEQIMSADKYPSIFSGQMEAIVYIVRGPFSCKLRLDQKDAWYQFCS